MIFFRIETITNLVIHVCGTRCQVKQQQYICSALDKGSEGRERWSQKSMNYLKIIVYSQHWTKEVKVERALCFCRWTTYRLWGTFDSLFTSLAHLIVIIHKLRRRNKQLKAIFGCNLGINKETLLATHKLMEKFTKLSKHSLKNCNWILTNYLIPPATYGNEGTSC